MSERSGRGTTKLGVAVERDSGRLRHVVQNLARYYHQPGGQLFVVS
jgi:hypothetical protein